MGTEVTTGNRLQQAGIVSLTKSLKSHELDRHRALLAVELEVVSVKVDRFGWGQMNDTLRKRLRQDWVDALQDFTLAEVQDACKVALGGNAKDAVNEEKIKTLVMQDRARRLAAIPKQSLPEPERALPDAETRRRIAAEILGRMDFAPKRMGGNQ